MPHALPGRRGTGEPALAAFRYKSFLSYSHSDERWGRWLHRSLETYRVPKRLVGEPSPAGPIPRRLTPIFRDREELPTATDLGAVIRDALDGSESMLVICSPQAAASRWVNEEIRYFRALGRSDRIFCLIVDGEPNAGPDAAECFPPALREALSTDGLPDGREHVAADARPGGDGRRNAKLKLIAGLLGVGLDKLKQRDQQRRHRRLVAIAAGAVAGMVVAIALATAALLARAEADRQRDRAELEAETSRQTTEFLVSLFDVADPGEARGNTITAREILDRGAVRIDEQLLDQPQVRANLLRTMGRVYTGLGLYGQATELLYASREAAVRTSDAPNESSVRTTTLLSAALYLEGDYARAGELAQTAVNQARALDGAPTPVLVTALIARADVQAQLEEDALAEANYREALDIDARLQTEESAERARALDGLGISLLYQGRLEESRDAMTEALGIRERVLGEDHPLTIEVLNNLAAVAHASEDMAETERLMRLAVPRARRVYGDAHPQTSNMLSNFGRVLLERRNIDEAERVLSESLAVDRVNKNPTHDDLTYSLNNLGLARAGQGRSEEAERLYLEALDIARLHDHRMQGPIEVNLIDLLCETGRPEAGMQRIEPARAALQAHYAEGDWRFDHLASVEGGCLARLGETERAATLLRGGHERLARARGSDWLFTSLAYSRLNRRDTEVGR